MKEKKESMLRHILLLQFNVFMFSWNGIFAKLAAKYLTQDGMFGFYTILFMGLMVANCGIYAIFWQQNLKHFEVNVAYAHRAVYNIWSLVWAVLIFKEHITRGNIIGTLLIILGIWVIQFEKA